MLRAVVVFASCLEFMVSARSYGTETACQRELRKVREGMNQDPPSVGGRIPECDAEGNYAPKQCSGSQCYCVLKDGSNIGYSVNRWEAQDQTCKCARDLEEYKQLRIIGKMHSCSANGSYEPVQCTGSTCYCADEDGQQAGPGVHVSRINELVC